MRVAISIAVAVVILVVGFSLKDSIPVLYERRNTDIVPPGSSEETASALEDVSEGTTTEQAGNTPPVPSVSMATASGDVVLEVEIADSVGERATGLSGRASLPQDMGLLFVFDHDARWGVWMPDMKFSIDVIWLNRKKEIVDIKKNLSPDTYPEVFMPQTEALYMLEANAGFSDQRKLNVGDVATFRLE